LTSGNTRLTFWGSGSDHGEEHPEPRHGSDRMGLTGGQDDGFAPSYLEALSRYGNLCLPVEHVDERIERGGVLAELLIGVEGE